MAQNVECRVGSLPHQYFSRIIILTTIMALCLSTATQAKYSSGTGEPNDPYLIATAENMNEIGANPDDWDAHFLLVADINLTDYTGTQFNIIGNESNPFTGVFDGNSHTISNFTYECNDTDYIGIFGYLDDPNAEIKDLTLIDPNVNATGNSSYVASIIGYLEDGTICGCGVVGGSIFGRDDVGGLVGESYFYGTVLNCYATSNVSGGEYGIGGLIGNNVGTISNCYATGSASGDRCVGGLVGIGGGTISYCYATGTVDGNDYIGGLLGQKTYTVIASFWDIEISDCNTSAGGHGKTTAEMKMASTYIGWGGCGNEGVWTINEGNDYPRLAWEAMPGQPLPTQNLADFVPGSGTESDPYLISSAQQLNLIGVFPCEWDKHFVLVSDINLSNYTGTQFNIIGCGSIPFAGVFEGNGHTISNFTCFTDTHNSDIGLFGYVDDPSAEIKNLTLTNPNVATAGYSFCTGSLVGLLEHGMINSCGVEGGSVSGRYNYASYIGGLVGENYKGTISNCYVTSAVSGDYGIGGLVGNNDFGTISDCYSAGSVSGDYRIGGLVGLNWNNSMISNCYTTGDVYGYDHVGGLVGYNDGTISNCYANGIVTGRENIGGLAGYNEEGTILNCYATGNVSGIDWEIGGLVGTNYKSTISNCYATGSISGYYQTGGLVGKNWSGRIMNCYAMGSVLGGDYTGGLVGYNRDNSMISNCYATGTVSGDDNIGGLVGFGGVIINSFWNIETSNCNTSAGGHDKTTAEMKMASIYIGWGGCGNDGIWTIDEGNDYPHLTWEGKPGKLIEHQLSDFLEGSGTQDDPYQVSTADQLNLIGAFPCEWDKFFLLIADINLSDYTGTQFNIIGTSGSSFRGVFDGNSHLVSNFTYECIDICYIGIFGFVDGPKAEIKNLTLIDPNIINAGSDSIYISALVGKLKNGTISGCGVKDGSISGRDRVGGLVGDNLSGTILNCYVTSNVSGDYGIGGLAGYNNGTISICYAKGAVSGNYNIGGLVGCNYGGGISDCYSADNVSGYGGVGGLVGGNENNSKISNCYAIGTVDGNDYTGGLVGYNSYYGTVTSSFWDVNTSGQSSSSGGTGKTTTEMKTRNTFTNAGWDFVNIWDICEGTNYPKLIWQILIADFACPDGVNFVDFAVLASALLSDANDPSWNPMCDISQPSDNVIDERDMMVFCDYWLEGL